jgi:cytochrome c oxidase cbb3-type subunit 3
MRIKYIFRIIMLTVGILFFNLATFAQDAALPTGGLRYFLYGVIGFVLATLSLTIYLVFLKNKYQKEAWRRSGKPKAQSDFRKWWSRLDAKYFTKAASLEKEADVLLDHDYDGIKELDNALPPWWKWGFYITIVVGVIYMFRFHVTKTGPTPLQEYEAEMKIAAAQLEDYRKNRMETFDEKTVTLANADGIADGKKIYAGTCFPCHGANGEGNAVGPNLTDKYWLHGGSLGEVFKTINLGVPDKGMQAWGKQFSPSDIRNLASFIMSLQGTKPANAKAPQGNVFEPDNPTDSTANKKDSLPPGPAK